VGILVSKKTYLLLGTQLSEFGKYLRSMRLRNGGQLTQEQLGERIGKGKMAVSGYESGKSTPPNDVVESIVDALGVTASEAAQLRFLAAQEQARIPCDIRDYFFEHPVIYRVIRIAQSGDMGDGDWEKMLEEMERFNERQ